MYPVYSLTQPSGQVSFPGIISCIQEEHVESLDYSVQTYRNVKKCSAAFWISKAKEQLFCILSGLKARFIHKRFQFPQTHLIYSQFCQTYGAWRAVDMFLLLPQFARNQKECRRLPPCDTPLHKCMSSLFSIKGSLITLMKCLVNYWSSVFFFVALTLKVIKELSWIVRHVLLQTE